MTDHPMMSPRAMLYQTARLASDVIGKKVHFKQISIEWGDEPYPLFVARLSAFEHEWKSRPCGTTTQAIDELLQAVEASHGSAYQD